MLGACSVKEIQMKSTSVWSLPLETFSWLKNCFTRCFVWSICWVFVPLNEAINYPMMFRNNPLLFPPNGCGPTHVHFFPDHTGIYSSQGKPTCHLFLSVIYKWSIYKWLIQYWIMSDGSCRVKTTNCEIKLDSFAALTVDTKPNS